MKKTFFLLISLCCSFGFAGQRTQVIRCLGMFQEGSLVIGVKGFSVFVNDEGFVTRAHDLKQSTEKNGAVTFSSDKISVSVPKIWIGKSFTRLHKSDPKNGHQITEYVKFGPLKISECESFFTGNQQRAIYE
jgi:hypothetical protein